MNFIKTTLIGGLIFMVPVVVVVVILGKAIEIMGKVAKPFSAIIPTGTVGGIAIANLLALVAIAIICFFAGMFAKSERAKKAYKKLDNTLQAIPGYAFIKGVTDSMNKSEEAAKSFLPVLVRFDDNSQIGFEVERLENGQVVVYLPGAPDPWSGSVVYFAQDRVTKLNLTTTQAISNIRQLGRGSTKLEEQL